MQAIVEAVLIIGMTPAVAAADVQTTPADRYSELSKTYGVASGAFRAASTDQERKAAVEGLAAFPDQFLQLADEHPGDPVALRALRQAVQAVNSTDSLALQAGDLNRASFPAGSKLSSVRAIVATLLRDHVESDKLGPICERMRYGIRKEYDAFLSTVMETNPHRSVQGMACLALAQVLGHHLNMIDLAEVRSEIGARYETVFDGAYLQAIGGSSRPALARRIEGLYEKATGYTDVELRPIGSVAERARAVLYEMRHLCVGKPAPDIEGQDQDGQPLQLSDYSGKVVLLYFWLEF
jgi:hypothetical protein